MFFTPTFQGDAIMARATRVGLALAVFVSLAAAGRASDLLSIQDIQLFNATPIPATVTNRGDVDRAIDGDPLTYSYLTPSGTSGPRYAGLDFGGSLDINRLRFYKASADVNGSGTISSMDLQLLYTTDTGPIQERNYLPVAGLTNGYLGNELVLANSIDTMNASVIGDYGAGFYSLSFNNVSATGLALGFAHSGDPNVPGTHYPVAEFTPMNGTTGYSIADIDVFRQEIPAGAVSANRGDQDLAIDGNLGTETYLTVSGTSTPTAAVLDLGAGASVDRIRVNKFTNNVAGGGTEPMDLQILYTTDTGPLEQRTYQPVSGLTNGFEGTELIVADTIDANSATVFGDLHQFPVDGWFSLTFNAVDATAIAFAFKKPDGAPIPWVHYPTTEIELYGTVVVLQPGDFNGDGNVDGDDFVIWQNNFPKSSEATLAMGDADGDGDVDGADFVVWQTNFPFTPGGGTSPVPEPASIILASLGGIVALARHRVFVKHRLECGS
jgi:hypothetical protein